MHYVETKLFKTWIMCNPWSYFDWNLSCQVHGQSWFSQILQSKNCSQIWQLWYLKYAKEENRRMISVIGETCHLDFCCDHPRYIRYLGYIRGNIVQQCAKDAWMTHTQGGGRSREVGLGKARICGGFFANWHCDQMLRMHCSVNVTYCGALCKCDQCLFHWMCCPVHCIGHEAMKLCVCDQMYSE